MKILAGMIAEPTINDASVNAERAVITAEQREGYGPQIRMADATRALFFAGQPLATHSPIGTTKTLQAATAKTLQAFHDRRSEEHTSELQSLMRNSYAVFCLKKKN